MAFIDAARMCLTSDGRAERTGSFDEILERGLQVAEGTAKLKGAGSGAQDFASALEHPLAGSVESFVAETRQAW